MGLRSTRDPHPASIDDTRWAQPAIFAIGYGLATLWRNWGCRPEAVLGHSLGELTAACVAGVFTLENALALVAARARLMGALGPGGGMLTVLASEETARRAAERCGARVGVAAINGVEHVVLSGPRTALEAVAEALEEDDVPCRMLVVSHAFHSAAMDELVPALAEAAALIPHAAPALPLVSNVTGTWFAADEPPSPAYWCRHLRAPVQFHRGLSTLVAHGIDTFVEMGPSPTLTALGKRSWPGANLDWIYSLARERDPWRTLFEAAAALHRKGVDLEGAQLSKGFVRHKVDAPTYPFERARCWMEVSEPRVADTSTARRRAFGDSTTSSPSCSAK
jgi:acyl transferase domain-containing protein